MKIKSALVFTSLFQLVLALVYGGLILLLAQYLETHYFHHPLAAEILVPLSSLLVLLLLEDMPRRLFQGLNKMFWFSFLEWFKSLLVLVFVVIGFLWFEKTIIVPTMAFLLATLIIGIVGIIVALRTTTFWKAPLKIDVPLLKDFFLFGLPLIFFVIGNKVIDSMDLLILTYFRPLEEVGVYSVVLPTAGLCLFFFRPLAVVMLSLGTELWRKGDLDQLRRLLSRVYDYLLLLVFPFIVLMMIYAEFLLTLLFGPAYASGATALRIILPGVFFFGAVHMNISVLTAVGNSKASGKIMFYGAIVNCLLNIILIPFFGMVGAAVATLVCYFVTFWLSWIYLHQENVHLDKKNFKFYLLLFLSLLLFVPVYFVQPLISTSVVSFLIICTVSFLSYIILINRLGFFSLTEMKELWVMIKSSLFSSRPVKEDN